MADRYAGGNGLAGVGVIALGLTAGIGAQKAAPAALPGGQTTLKISTRIVVLDVVVTDRKGNAESR